MGIALLGISRALDAGHVHGPLDIGPCECDDFRWVTQGSLAAAVVSPLPTPAGPLRQARFLEAIHQQIGVLPVRFGALLPDEQAAKDFLRQRHDALLVDLDRLSDTGEIGVRIEFDEEPAAPGQASPPGGASESPPSPLDYLARRRRRYQWKDGLDGLVRAAAESCARAMADGYQDVRSRTPSPPGVLRLAFLVQRSRFDDFCRRLETWVAATTCRRHLIVGPWPPYSFA
jgi:hypothetical protein